MKHLSMNNITEHTKKYIKINLITFPRTENEKKKWKTFINPHLLGSKRYAGGTMTMMTMVGMLINVDQTATIGHTKKRDEHQHQQEKK